MVSADLLVAWLDIALDHETLYQFMKFRINHDGCAELPWRYEPAARTACWSWSGWYPRSLPGSGDSFPDIFHTEDEDLRNGSSGLPLHVYLPHHEGWYVQVDYQLFQLPSFCK